MTAEHWRDIPGFERQYQVSDLGRVRSVIRYRRCIHKGKEVIRLYRGKLLRPGARKSGHVVVSLGASHGTIDVHRLVMRAFVGPCPRGFEVLHLNHVPADNRLVNLKYGTRSENVKMDFAAGKRPKYKGSPRKLNRSQVYEMRLLRGIPQRKIASMFGISQSMVSDILTGKNWTQ